jgi:hypothetical protein
MKAILQKLYGNNKTKTELKKVELSAISEISEGYKQTMYDTLEALEYAIELVMDAEQQLVRVYSSAEMDYYNEKALELEQQVKELGIDVPEDLQILVAKSTEAEKLYDVFASSGDFLEGARYDLVTFLENLNAQQL